MDKQNILNSIGYIQVILHKLRACINGVENYSFSDLEKSDLCEIIGLEEDELEEILERNFK